MHNIIYCMHTMQVTGNDEHARFPIFRFEQVLVLLIGAQRMRTDHLSPPQPADTILNHHHLRFRLSRGTQSIPMNRLVSQKLCSRWTPSSGAWFPTLGAPTGQIGNNFRSAAGTAAASFTPGTRSFGVKAGASDRRRGRRRPRSRNARLEEVKGLGLTHLEQTAQDVSAKASEPLFVSEEDGRPTVRQVKEANRIHAILDECIEAFSKKDRTFSVGGDPIMILDVEVSRDLRDARAYWTLPFSLVQLPDNVRAEIKKRMQAILEKRGGKLQALVHHRLRFKYNAKLRFVPAEDDILATAMKDMIQ